MLVHNVDILTNFDLRDLIAAHRGYYATLLVQEAKEEGRGLRFNADGVLKGWENTLTGEQKKVDEGFAVSRRYNFCGVQIVSPEFMANMQGSGSFSIIDEYLEQAKRHEIRMFLCPGFCMDVGTPEALREAERLEVAGRF